MLSDRAETQAENKLVELESGHIDGYESTGEAPKFIYLYLSEGENIPYEDGSGGYIDYSNVLPGKINEINTEGAEAYMLSQTGDGNGTSFAVQFYRKIRASE